MANTTNFGWETPDDTDLVKDGAAAMRTLGNSIDASMGDLKGGTTGQALVKNSNTDMDFIWSTISADITAVNAGTGISGGGTSGDVTITNSMATAIDAKGDLIAGTANDTFSRLAVGTNNQVLTADSSTATGLKWASPSVAKNYVLIADSGFISGSTAYTYSGLSGYDDIKIGFFLRHGTSAGQERMRINGDTGSNYYQQMSGYLGTANFQQNYWPGAANTGILLGASTTTSGANHVGYINLSGCNTAGVKQIVHGGGVDSTAQIYTGAAEYNSSSVVSSVTFDVTAGQAWTYFRVLIYGAN